MLPGSFNLSRQAVDVIAHTEGVEFGVACRIVEEQNYYPLFCRAKYPIVELAPSANPTG